jgi:PAS domain S-box-containing protein
VPVVFIAAVMVALAVVPAIMGRKAEKAQRRITEVLDPARLLGTRLSQIQARQMSDFQAFLLTGDRSFKLSYDAYLKQEGEIYAGLQAFIGGMDLKVRERLVRLSTLTTRWHLGHRGAFESEETRQEMRGSFNQEQARFEELQNATLDLEQALQNEVDQGFHNSAYLRSLQTRISMGLLLLALGGTVVVALVGRRLLVLRHEAEARRNDALRARREIDAVLNATTDGVLGIDLEGGVISLNPAGAKLLGWTEWELRGRDVHEVLHHTTSEGDPRPREDSPILKALSKGGAGRSSGDDVLWRRDGTPLPVRWTLEPLVDGLEVRGAVLTFTDMTDIRQKEDALRRAVRVREEVLSVVSHDLRNPLGVVRGAADLLLDLPLDEAERRKQAGIIRRSALRMGRLIEDLLDISRIEAGALVVRAAAEEPRVLLEETFAVFESQAAERGIELVLNVPDDLPRVRVDPDRIQQALVNLVANALKFTPDAGHVVLGAREEESTHVALFVSDDGPGIAPDDADRLFDRFWQASRSDRTGAGLGLAIVRGIAEAHGGSVHVVSEPGKGATFNLIVPVASESNQRGAVNEELPEAGEVGA